MHQLLEDFEDELDRLENETNYSIDIVMMEVKGCLSLVDEGLDTKFDVVKVYNDTLTVRESKDEQEDDLTPKQAAEYVYKQIDRINM